MASSQATGETDAFTSILLYPEVLLHTIAPNTLATRQDRDSLKTEILPESVTSSLLPLLNQPSAIEEASVHANVALSTLPMPDQQKERVLLQADDQSVIDPRPTDQALSAASTDKVAARGLLNSAMIALVKWPYKFLEKFLNLVVDYGAKPMIRYGMKPIATWTRGKGTDAADPIRKTSGWLNRKG
ncbi:hypothetical protein [Endozoicomonas sp. SCSIO W0465]|uniref:hypothetical protein n=1 Tax=Endozoicomonas sp. SCSIO W0465 TaxID=2918516 RepID=UPI00207506AC|nr:hypothetical protein [Endozoicomonas sp. SCSIO W0465]USE33859.1 hypothetical protein MJO57_16945 [Endozoicomonas sp. SCSIO W0465]